MRVLLDTHAFLWFILADSQLSGAAKGIIENPGNDVAVSPASYWEIAIKIQLGKYALQEPFRQFFDKHVATNNFSIIPVEPRHAEPLTTLPTSPPYHKDPFDRLIIAQAMVEGIPVVSADRAFDAYPVTVHW